jgi:hypothetical protein
MSLLPSVDVVPPHAGAAEVHQHHHVARHPN